MTVGAGVNFKHLALLGLLFFLAIIFLLLSRPYLLQRVETFINPTKDPDAGYQIKQSLIGIGSGGWFGRGLGQGVQKFKYLPEPSSDSIFSVAAEEFGFIGSIFFVFLYVFLALRGLFIASYTPDRFGGLVVIGIVILITTQSFINIGSVIGLFPFTGEPLTFISHGGTSLLFTLASVGIVLNISRYKTKRLQRI
jgi:cell division protein FtsW